MKKFFVAILKGTLFILVYPQQKLAELNKRECERNQRISDGFKRVDAVFQEHDQRAKEKY